MLCHEKFYGTIDGYDDKKNKFIIKFDTGTNYHGDGLVGIEELAEVPVAPALGSHPQLSSHATSSASVSNVHPSPISGYTSLLEQGHQYMASFSRGDEHESFQFESSSVLQASAPSYYAAPSASFEQHERFSPPPMANEKGDLGLAFLVDYGANGSAVKELALGENPGFVDPYIGSEDKVVGNDVGLKTTGETEHEVRYYKYAVSKVFCCAFHIIFLILITSHYILILNDL